MTATVSGRRPVEGEAAPDFTLHSTSGHPVTLSSFRGRQAVLIAFFPGAFTSTCTDQICAFSEDYDQFAEAGVEVLPVSVDSVATLKEFKSKYGIRADLLSDFKRELSSSWDMLFGDHFFSNRAYVLVDINGVVRWMHVEESPGDRRENAEILAQIASLT